MIETSALRYDLIVITPAGQRLHLAESVRGLGWEENPGELAVRLQAEAANSRLESGWLHQLVSLGAQVQLLADWGAGWAEIFRGTVFGWSYSTAPLGWLRITAYDPLIYLSRSKDDRFYPAGTTARTIIADVAAAWGIPLGVVEGPDVALAKQVFRQMTVAEMITSALEEARQRGGGRWVVRSSAGKIDIIRTGQNSPVYHLGAADVVQEVQDERSIEDLVTRVLIIGTENAGGRRPVVARNDGRTEFGVLQEILAEEQFDSPAAAKAAAKQVIADRGQPRVRRRIVAPDLPFLRRGDRVHIAAGTLNGYYLVAGVQHDADARQMSLEVEDSAG